MDAQSRRPMFMPTDVYCLLMQSQSNDYRVKRTSGVTYDIVCRFENFRNVIERKCARFIAGHILH